MVMKLSRFSRSGSIHEKKINFTLYTCETSPNLRMFNLHNIHHTSNHKTAKIINRENFQSYTVWKVVHSNYDVPCTTVFHS